MEHGFSIADILAIIRRRLLLLVAPVVVCVAVATGVAFILPPEYTSVARILVESQQIPRNLAQSTVNVSANERVQLIRQRLMTRENLLDVAQRYELFAGQSLSPTEIFREMREAASITSVELATAGRDNVSVSTINIAFRWKTARVAAQVANDFLTQVLQENIRQRNQRAVGTLQFFDQEVARLSDELRRIEESITEFKRVNGDALPGSLEFRRGAVIDLQRRIFEREARRLQLETELQTINERMASGEIGETGGSPAQQELRRLRRQLIEREGIYAPEHPAMRMITGRIQALEATLASVGEDPDAPPAAVVSVKRRIDRITEELALIERQITEDRERIVAMQEAIERTPAVELELNELERSQRGVQIQFNEAVQKRADAAIGERLEVNQQGERFEVIEQPLPPEEPGSPNRPLIIAGGFGVGVMLGGALAALVEFLGRCIRTPRDLEAQLGVRPLVTVPYIGTDRERTRRAWRWRAKLFLLFAIAPLSLFLIDRYYMPLPVFWRRVAEVTGYNDLVRLVASGLGG